MKITSENEKVRQNRKRTINTVGYFYFKSIELNVLNMFTLNVNIINKKQTKNICLYSDILHEI